MGTKNYRHNAFTLVELLIVFSILVILAIILIAYFRNQVHKGNDARRRADIGRMKVAVEEYEKDHNCYPPLSDMQACGTDPAIAIHPYLSPVPCDPVTRLPYVYETSCTTVGCCPVWYRFYADMDYAQDPDLTPGIGPGGAYNYVSGSDNAPVPLAGATPTPPGRGLGPQGEQYYGCRSGVCVTIDWVFAVGRPECNPSFQIEGCNGNCGTPSNPFNECIEL
jgi:type II secretory pathway pseudopilin PulG